MKLVIEAQELFDLILRHFNIPKHKAEYTKIKVELYPTQSVLFQGDDIDSKHLEVNKALLYLCQGAYNDQLDLDINKIGVGLDVYAKNLSKSDYKEDISSYSIEAEQCVLGFILAHCIHKADIDPIFNTLNPKDFYRTAHQTIFSAMETVRMNKKEPDALEVSNVLDLIKELENIGGRYYLGLLLSNAPVVDTVLQYVEIIKQKADRRNELVRVSQ